MSIIDTLRSIFTSDLVVNTLLSILCTSWCASAANYYMIHHKQSCTHTILWDNISISSKLNFIAFLRQCTPQKWNVYKVYMESVRTWSKWKHTSTLLFNNIDLWFDYKTSLSVVIQQDMYMVHSCSNSTAVAVICSIYTYTYTYKMFIYPITMATDKKSILYTVYMNWLCPSRNLLPDWIEAYSKSS